MAMNDELFKFIKSGEFTFCSRCGRNVRYGKKEFMCKACKRGLFDSMRPVTTEEVLSEKYENKISALIREHREELAELRQNG